MIPDVAMHARPGPRPGAGQPTRAPGHAAAALSQATNGLCPYMKRASMLLQEWLLLRDWHPLCCLGKVWPDGHLQRTHNTATHTALTAVPVCIVVPAHLNMVNTPPPDCCSRTDSLGDWFHAAALRSVPDVRMAGPQTACLSIIWYPPAG
jgi:hypothetical protein